MTHPSAPIRPTPGSVQASREFLGLTGEEFAGQLGVRADTARRWESGRDPIPARVGSEIDELLAHTAERVADLVEDLEDVPAVRVWRTTDELHAHDVSARSWGWPARWWRHVAARAVAEVPAAVIVSSPALCVRLHDNVGDSADLVMVVTLESGVDVDAIVSWVETGWSADYAAVGEDLARQIRADCHAVLTSAVSEPGRGSLGGELLVALNAVSTVTTI